MGEYDLNQIEIIGDLKPIPDFKIPTLVDSQASTGSSAMQAFMESRTLMRPKADPQLCTACGLCVDQCPVSALSMDDCLPIVDTDTCVACFCCQEMCPEKAIPLR